MLLLLPVIDGAHFSFDRCFGQDADQADVYDALVAEPMEALFEGYNSTILAYGQTGSGKTYSMVGTEDEPGIIPRFSRELFERASCHEGAKVTASYLQLYNEGKAKRTYCERLGTGGEYAPSSHFHSSSNSCIAPSLNLT